MDLAIGNLGDGADGAGGDLDLAVGDLGLGGCIGGEGEEGEGGVGVHRECFFFGCEFVCGCCCCERFCVLKEMEVICLMRRYSDSECEVIV